MTDLELAKILWDYMHLNMKIHKCDCIIGLGCNDFAVPQKCAELYQKGYANIIIFSGGRGKCTESWEKNESEKFYDIAISLGVPKNKIYLENKSTNTGDNFKFTKK